MTVESQKPKAMHGSVTAEPALSKAAAHWQEAIEAWEDYKATGLHATADEVEDWLLRLERGETVAPPECHR